MVLCNVNFCWWVILKWTKAWVEHVPSVQITLTTVLSRTVLSKYNYYNYYNWYSNYSATSIQMQHHVHQQRFLYYINSTNYNTNGIQMKTAADKSHNTIAMIQIITLYYIVLHCIALHYITSVIYVHFHIQTTTTTTTYNVLGSQFLSIIMYNNIMHVVASVVFV